MSKHLPPEISREFSVQRIQQTIYIIRGQKVMLDRHLAALYGVPTKALKQAVRRNLSRFPSDFMFPLTPEEFVAWRSQFVTSKFEWLMVVKMCNEQYAMCNG